MIAARYGYDADEVLRMVDLYGFNLVSLFFQLIDKYKSQPALAAAQAGGPCDPALAEALCAAECKALEALVAAHKAREVAGCCPHGH